MYCSHCGKENTEGNQFCEHCGKPLTQQTTAQPNMPPRQNIQPQQAYPWQQTNIDPEVKRKWEEQKAHVREIRMEKRTKVASVMWLVAGIFQILIGIIYIQNWQSFNTRYPYWIVASISFCIAMFLMGTNGIYFFVKRKERSTALRSNRLLIPIIQSIVQVILLLENLFFLSRWGTFSKDLIIKQSVIMHNAAYVVIVIGALFATFPAIIDFINMAIAKKQKNVSEQIADTQTKKKSIVMCVLIATCCFVIISSVFIGIQHIENVKYEAEQQRVISLVKNGYLLGYTDKPIEETLEIGIAKLDQSTYQDDDYIRDYNWDYDPYQPQLARYESHNIGKELSPDDVLVSTWFGFEPIKNERIRIYITFKLNEANNEITVYAVSSMEDGPSYTFTDDEIEEWVDFFFGGRQELIERGEDYVNNGMYISSTQTLYATPDFNNPTTYKYNSSGKKPILDYQISQDGTQLWLKVSGSGDGKYDYFWVPES